MRKPALFQIFLIIFFLGYETAFSETEQTFTLCIVDEKRLTMEYPQAKQIYYRFLEDYRRAKKRYKKDLRKLEKDTRAFEQYQASLPQSVSNSHAQDLALRLKALQNRRREINQELVKFDAELKEHVMRSSIPSIRSTAKERDCTVAISLKEILYTNDRPVDNGIILKMQ